MNNLIYAIEQLGKTPTCDVSALGTQPQGTLTVVTMGNPADTWIEHLGVGVNNANGTIVLHLAKEGIDLPITKISGTSTTPEADAKALFTQVDTLAQQWLTAHGYI